MAFKDFSEALRDGFSHITEITDKEALYKLREDGIDVDGEGYWVYCFGENKEYELCIEPFGEEGQFYISLYKHRVRLTEKLPVIWIAKKSPS